jgi:hypothetical protein
MDRETLEQNFWFVILLRAKAKGTSIKEEYLAISKELRERVKSSKKSAEGVSSQEVLTTKEYEIDPKGNLDEQLGVILEGEMRDKEIKRKKVE